MPRTFLGHPRGLLVCFTTELWERFAYYGMLSLLILYLIQGYGLSDAEGNRIVAAYGALIWMLPVVGGFVADRWLGSRKAAIAGMLFIGAGFLSISFPALLLWSLQASPSDEGRPPLEALFLSMAVISVGVGFFKSNIAATVGRSTRRRTRAGTRHSRCSMPVSTSEARWARSSAAGSGISTACATGSRPRASAC
jgi:POT family proton-dependent oligopeptide transporter